MESYPAPKITQLFELEIKRSRFITSVARVEDKPAAKEFIATVRAKYPDANHHCWAIVAGRPNDSYQHDQSDDGEPKGTAGKPMLNVLTHSGLGNTAVVVSRYFGGIKLGAGGLVRAYTQAVSEALAELNTEPTYIREEVTIDLPYTSFDIFEHWLQTKNTSITDKEFSTSVVVTLAVPVSEILELKEKLQQVSGKIIQSSFK